MAQKCVFEAGVTVRTPCVFWATDRAQILTIFETTDVNWCLGHDQCEKFPNFCAGSFAGPKTIFGSLDWVLTQCTAQMPHFSQNSYQF